MVEPFAFESHRAHRGIFPATTNCLAFALFRELLLRCNILLTCTIKSFARQAATNASGAADTSDGT
ncbi:MAG: hypothetical protein M3Z96_00305 [Pseudomonadota bacterium]|nr:hypothetical protein [Pseudomonadota bacterium]